jgi:hypothetical protein
MNCREKQAGQSRRKDNFSLKNRDRGTHRDRQTDRECIRERRIRRMEEKRCVPDCLYCGKSLHRGKAEEKKNGHD